MCNGTRIREDAAYVKLISTKKNPLFMEHEHYASLQEVLLLSLEKAMSYFQQIKTLCEQNGVPVPKLDADVAKKLDPLNRYRVEAAKYEADATKAHSTDSAIRDLIRAAESWLKAKESEEVNRTATQAGKLLLKSDRDYSFSRMCSIFYNSHFFIF